MSAKPPRPGETLSPERQLQGFVRKFNAKDQRKHS